MKTVFSRLQPKLLRTAEPQNQRNLLVPRNRHRFLPVEAEILEDGW